MPTLFEFHLAGLTQYTQWNTIQVFLGLTQKAGLTQLKLRHEDQGVHIDITEDWVNKPSLRLQKGRMQVEIKFQSSVTTSTTAINHKVVPVLPFVLRQCFLSSPSPPFCFLPFISQVVLNLNNRPCGSLLCYEFYKFVLSDCVTVTTM